MIAGPGGADLPRFTTLAALAVVMTFLLVVVGAIVRATDSGLGCPEWPTCHGSWIPPLDDPHAIIEWSHRTTAALTGLVVAALAIAAVVSQRNRRTVLVSSVGAAAVVVFQAWLGKMAVESELSGDIVVAHLATAMGLFALVLFVWVRSRYPVHVAQAGGWTAFTVLAALTVLATYGLMLLGAHLTATGTALVFDDWPTMDGGLWPTLDPGVLPHVLHRWASVAVGVLVAGTVWLGVRGETAPISRLAILAGALYLVQVAIGGAQVLTSLAPWTQVAHVAVGAATFGVLLTLVLTAHLEARTAFASDAYHSRKPS